jgi:hypothetical protein
MRGFFTAAALLIAAPAAAQESPSLAMFDPLIGKTWAGKSTAPGSSDVDVQQWERILGGAAVRVTHSLNQGAYGGETIIWRRKDGEIAYHYVTTGGFTTHGTFARGEGGTIVAEEAVEGHAEIDLVRSTMTLTADGYGSRATYRRKSGEWAGGHGFDYRTAEAGALVWRKAE